MNIVTLTLNPALDKSTSVSKMVPENKLRCAPMTAQPGGGGINVSRVIRRLGGESLAVFPCGGASGELLLELLRQEEVPVHPISTEAWTRESFVVLEESTLQQYRFVLPGAEVSEAECRSIADFLASMATPPDYLVASGSLPPGFPVEWLIEIGQAAKQRGTRFVVDTSGDALPLIAEHGVFLLKPNLKELSALAGVETVSGIEQEHIAQRLIDEGKCEMIVVSQGPRGAMLATREGIHYLVPPTIVAKSTVGAGDSMVAGMVHALSQGLSPIEVVRLGVACGTAATMNRGTELSHMEDVQTLLPLIKVI